MITTTPKLLFTRGSWAEVSRINAFHRGSITRPAGQGPTHPDNQQYRRHRHPLLVTQNPSELSRLCLNGRTSQAFRGFDGR